MAGGDGTWTLVTEYSPGGKRCSSVVTATVISMPSPRAVSAENFLPRCGSGLHVAPPPSPRILPRPCHSPPGTGRFVTWSTDLRTRAENDARTTLACAVHACSAPYDCVNAHRRATTSIPRCAWRDRTVQRHPTRDIRGCDGNSSSRSHGESGCSDPPGEGDHEASARHAPAMRMSS